jgi:flagellar biosynthetic protein FlhB
MAAGFEQERTESATPKRREQAREKGQVAHSREVVSTSLFVGSLIFFAFTGAALYQQMVQLLREALTRLDTAPLTPEGFYDLLLAYSGRVVLLLLPFTLTVMVLALVSNILQTGWLLAPQALLPDAARLNPWQGLRRIISLHAVHELVKSLIKVGVVGYVAYATIAGAFPNILPLYQHSVPAILEFLGRQSLRLGTNIAYVLIVLAVLDYGFQRWQYEKSLRMTLQEIKEEQKESDGNPQIKSRIRSLMRERARQRMMAEVPKADVVITNPTHLAVALRYRREEMTAPMVIAKGADYVAERIKAIAREHRIPLVENRVVAQNLYRHVELGEAIPETLYKAVAEILAYVYRLRPRAVI